MHVAASAELRRSVQRTSGVRRRVHLALPLLTAALAMTVALVVAGGAPGASPAGLPDAGAVVGWGAPLARLLLDLCAIATVGALLVAVVLVPFERGGAPFDDPGVGALRSAAAWSAAWVVTALVDAALTVSEVTGVPLQRLPREELLAAAWALPATRALLQAAACAAAALAWVLVSRRRNPVPWRGGAVVALVLALVALTPPVYAGHSAHASEHELATGALVVHVVAATVWLGGLAGLALHLRASDRLLLPAVARFSTVAFGCFCALTATGLVAAVAGLGTTRANWLSPYAGLVAVKAAAAVVLGGIGWAHRRWTIARLAAGRPRAFTRLVAVELAVMGASVGVAVALSRTPGATGGGLLERATRSVGPGSVATPVSAGGLLADWRPEPVLSTVAVLALGAYLVGVRRTTGNGRSWPNGRIAAAIGAVFVAVVAVGLPTSYDANALLAVQTAQHLALALVVPALIGLSGVDALIRLVRGESIGTFAAPRWGSHAAGPATGFIVLVAVTVVVLNSPLQSAAAMSSQSHVLSMAASMAAGLVFCRSLLGPGEGAARRRVRERERAPVLVLAALYLIGAGFALAHRAAGMEIGDASGGTDPDQLRIANDLVAAARVLWLFVAGLGLAGPASRRTSSAVRVRGLTPPIG